MAAFFLTAGTNHFRDPQIYLSIMPPYLPWPQWLNWISGAAEMAGGFGLLVPVLKRPAGWGLIALLIAVFPANIHMALQGGVPGMHIPQWVLWLRLPFQLVFIAWVYWTILKGGRGTPHRRRAMSG
ncbi:MAG: DoxX family protein [Verrucomicrobiaceae bacterium]|nr:DoxX family protein [Verrucomicrobiaceae bacterium]